MAVTLGRLTDYNKINPNNWAAGSGSATGFNANGNTAEQNRYTGTNPWGGSQLVWQTVPSGDGQADGGWNTDAFAIDNTKLYRYSVWVRRTSSTGGGTFYFGTQSSTGAVTHLTDGASNTNPYWDYRSTGWFTQNVWYLVVGHCFPYTHNGTQAHVDSGFYTIAGGANGKVALNGGNIPGDCKWQSGSTTSYQRVYHYYCGDATTRLEFFWPRVDILDGSEPSIAHLLTTYLPPDGLTYSNGTMQGTTPTNSPNTPTLDRGDLIDVQSFPVSGTWTNPGASMVHVKLIGGGGGGAGYCEGGGAGGYAEGFYNVSLVSSVAVTVGGGGNATGYYSAGGNGGTSSFGGYLSSIGGYGANQQYSHSGGHGGNSFGGAQFSVQGGAGCGHINSVGHAPAGVIGGAGYFGGPAAHARNHSNLGWSIQHEISSGAPGAGGSGNITDWGWTQQSGRGHSAGAPGQSGLVIVYSYK